MKLPGIMLIGVSCVLLCVLTCAEKSRRGTELRSAVELMVKIRGELGSKLSSIPELTASLERNCGGITQDFLKNLEKNLHELGEISFSGIWSESVKETYTHLTSEELEAVCGLGGILGHYGVSIQLEALERCAAQLREAERQFALTAGESRKLEIGIVCTCCTVLAVVLT